VIKINGSVAEKRKRRKRRPKTMARDSTMAGVEVGVQCKLEIIAIR
jgi:hypothetical protein